MPKLAVPVGVFVDAVLGGPVKDAGGSLPLQLCRRMTVLVVEIPLNPSIILTYSMIPGYLNIYKKISGPRIKLTKKGIPTLLTRLNIIAFANSFFLINIF